MSDTTITSANSVVTLSVAGLFPVPVQLEGYETDKAWSTSPVEMSESQMSIDGRKTSGYIFNQIPQTFTLQADSPSKFNFLTPLVNYMRQIREVLYISGTIDLPSTGESFNCIRGTLKSAHAIPDANRTLGSIDFTIEWESIQSN